MKTILIISWMFEKKSSNEDNTRVAIQKLHLIITSNVQELGIKKKKIVSLKSWQIFFSFYKIIKQVLLLFIFLYNVLNV